MNVRICDACGKEITNGPRVSVEVRVTWDFKRNWDFHARDDCLIELPDMVKKLGKEARG